MHAPRRTLAAAAAILAAATGTAAHAAAAPAPALGATTVIRATRPAWADVTLRKAATMATPFGSTPDLSVHATGRLAAFVLVGTQQSTQRVRLVGGEMANGEDFLFAVPQHPSPGGGTYETVKTFGDQTTIPAGTYRLYVVPDGGAATFTLRLRGVSGRSTIVPSHAATAEVTGSDGPATPAPNAFAAGVTRTLGARGFALQVLHADAGPTAAWELAMCHNVPDPAIPDPIRTAPGCPNADKRTLVDHRLPEREPDAKYFVQAFAGLPKGEHGLSATFSAQGVVSRAEYATLWLAY